MSELSDLTFRRARPDDARYLWDMVEQIGTLEQNSSYCYLLITTMFEKTCAVVEHGAERVGFLLGVQPPARPDTLFVWQVGVLPEYRKSRLATGLLLQGLEQSGSRYLEATVGVHNANSRALFVSLARRLGTDCQIEPCFAPEDFPGEHEAEQLFRVGPIDTNSPQYRQVASLYLPTATALVVAKGQPE